jgi:hypothetical protein
LGLAHQGKDKVPDAKAKSSAVGSARLATGKICCLNVLALSQASVSEAVVAAHEEGSTARATANSLSAAQYLAEEFWQSQES